VEIILKRSDKMADKIVNGKKVEVPTQNYKTAPITAFSNQKPISKVPLPQDEDVERAKEWVDTNRK
jgi:hypothetical protein